LNEEEEGQVGASPRQGFTPEEEQRLVIEDELEKDRDRLGEDFGLLKDLALKLRVEREAGFVYIFYDGAKVYEVEDTAFAKSLSIAVENLLYRTGLIAKLRNPSRAVEALGRALFKARKFVESEELFMISMWPFYEKLKALVERGQELVQFIVDSSPEFDEEKATFERLRTEEKAKVVSKLLSEVFEFAAVKPLEPHKPVNYFVLDDNVLRDVDHVVEPVCGALIRKGLATKTLKENVDLAIKSTTKFIAWDQVDPWDKLNLKYGVLDLKDLKIEVGQGYYFRYRLDVHVTQEELNEIKKGAYDIKDNEVYKAWRDHFDKEDWEYLVNNLGVWLDHKRAKLVVFIIGPPNVGKSTLLENLTRPIDRIIGKKDLRSIIEDPFGLAELVGKQINVSSEKVAVTLRNIEIINKLVGEHDFIDVRVKHKPSTVMRSLKTMWFAMNDPPTVTEYGGATMGAFLGRLNIIFMKAPEGFKPIRGFDVDQKEAFKFLLCCRALFDVEGREIKRRDEEYMLNYLMEATNSALQFLKSDWIIIDPSAKVKGTELYNAYVAYCKEQGITPMGRNEFYSVVESKFSRISMEKAHDKTTWFRGVMLNPRKRDEAERTLEDFA
jgi:phage/plasmid-associated DNA primase